MRKKETQPVGCVSFLAPSLSDAESFLRVGYGQDEPNTPDNMVTDLYAHILDEDRKVNAQRFEAAFYANPDMRKVEREIVEQAKPQPQPQSAAVDLQQLFAQLQQNPEVLGQLAAMLKAV